jgi:hypothetical protein
MFRPTSETLMLDVRNADPGIAGNAGIGSALKAITAGSRAALAAERGGIMCDFANRMAAARATADPRQLAGILRAIKEQRQAALATAARNAQREGSEKRQAILQGQEAQRPSGSSRPGAHAPKK